MLIRDVREVETFKDLPAVGETGILYYEKQLYRVWLWGGTQYYQIAYQPPVETELLTNSDENKNFISTTKIIHVEHVKPPTFAEKVKLFINAFTVIVAVVATTVGFLAAKYL